MMTINSTATAKLQIDPVKRAKPIRAVHNPASWGFLMYLYKDFLTKGTFSSKKFRHKDLRS